MRSSKAPLPAVLAVVMAIAAPASAQIGLPQTGGGGVLPGLPAVPGGGVVRDLADRTLGQTLDRVLQAPGRLQTLIRRSRGALEADPQGWPVVSGELVALDLSDDARARALEAGFTVVREERLEALGLTTVVMAPPRRMALRQAAGRLQALAPEADVTFNHVLSPAGATALPASGAVAQNGSAPGARLGLIDTGIEATHPALVGSAVEQRGFAGPPRMGAHGTAVASLMVGSHGPFRGGAPGAALKVADIYGGQAAGGSSTALASALAWMVESRVSVVNVSLVGPRNALVERAVVNARSRGLILVAAVGNDGPAAPPLYPADYPGVVGVTAVNARDRALPEAARGDQVDFAAPGADMAAAGQAGSWTTVRGSSFAAPLVAGLIAARGGGTDAVRSLANDARDLGERGRDATYGDGLLATDRRTAPSVVNARGRLTR